MIIIQWIVSFFLLFCVILFIHVFRLFEKTKSVFKISNQSLDVVRNNKLDEEKKEKQLQKNAIELFRLFFLLFILGAIAFLLPLGLVKIFCIITHISISTIYQVTFSPLFISITVIISIILFTFGKKRKKYNNRYSFIERVLHYIAFNTYWFQISVSDLAGQFLVKEFKEIDAHHPVFITGLPRSGTTLLLECCAKLPDFAAHCYRDIPFVLMPFIWNKFSSSFQKTGELKERAHGDGMMINFDSPEAFEEVIWKTFWKKNYTKEYVLQWQLEENELFLKFFQNHMHKIVSLRSNLDLTKSRYVSKNNMNIARIEFLNKYFPESIIIIPFRDPLQHAMSSLKQHLNFLFIHQENPFAAKYMKAIGHFDFGIHLRPINFQNWYLKRRFKDSKTLGFWLEYWIASYDHLSGLNYSNIHFINYDQFCKNPKEGLAHLGQMIRTEYQERLITFADTIHLSKKREINNSMIPNEMIRKANDLYSQLANKTNH